MITDDDIEKAIDWLRDQAKPASKARAEREYMTEYRKVMKSTLMRERMTETLGAQEAFAYADPRYKQHLEVMRDAIEKDEYYRWMLTAAETKVEVWRTENANQRALGTFK